MMVIMNVHQKVFNISNSDINDDAVYLILYGLRNNTTVY